MGRTKDLYDILRGLQNGDYGTDGAHIKICALFNVGNSLSWLEWKNKFQRIMYENDQKTEYIKLLSNGAWVDYFVGKYIEGKQPKEAFEEYLEECTEEP